MEKKITFGNFIFMMTAFAIYSATGIFSKSASFFPFLSLGYLANFAGVILMLGIYAIMWQVILKKLPLTVAFLWKNTGIFFGLLYSRFIFGEQITLNNLLGIVIILVGLIVISKKK